MPHEPKARGKSVTAGLDAGLYAGRGQTFAKHVLLKQYVTELVFKVLQAPNPPVEFLYVDRFSGPWQSKGERFEDTSFSIVLKILTDAREALGSRGRFPRMRAVFVEDDPGAYARLRAAVGAFPRVNVTAMAGRFEDAIPGILPLLGPGTFLFAFLDPKGWKGLALERMRPLLRHPHAEVLVNLMTYSLVRHVGFELTQESFGEFFGGGDWRAELDGLMTTHGREEAILMLYLSRLRVVGGFPYVGTTRIRDPDAARTYFHLAYGTRHHAGMEVFRRSEARCIEVQERVVLESLHDRRERRSGMRDLLAGIDDTAPDAFAEWREASRRQAKEEFDAWLRGGPPMPSSRRTALLLQHPYVDGPLVRSWARAAAKAGELRVEDGNGKDVRWTPTGSGPHEE